MAKRKLTMKHIPKSKSDDGWGCCIGIMVAAIAAFAVSCYFFGFNDTMTGVAIIFGLMFVIVRFQNE